ncbi:hypothetical protein G6F61_007638 [Rhizopus arrhizus]|nr:hypothetical protein G6F42_004540 [Rhizopus arrhizus]KAG1376389.1 hypothetical protein G6F61_007638 [Rhizopus arrhizus]
MDRQRRMKKENFKRFKDPIVHTWFDCLQRAREVVLGRVVHQEAREYEPIKADGSSMCFQLRSLVVKGEGWVDGLGHFACQSMTRQQDKGCGG